MGHINLSIGRHQCVKVVQIAQHLVRCRNIVRRHLWAFRFSNSKEIEQPNKCQLLCNYALPRNTYFLPPIATCLKNAVFWDLSPCGSSKYRRFGETCRLHLQSRRNIASEEQDRLCGLVVRVLGYRSGGPGSIPGTTRKKCSGSGTGSTQPREYNWGATW
jgi:hypothetical protein